MDRSQGRSLKDKYLVTYNFVSALLWLGVLARTILSLPLVGAENVYAAGVGDYTRWTQTLALLEIVHIVLGLLKSSLATTVLQVSSRILLVWGIAYLFQAPQESLAYSSMLIAWSVTEVCRYSYYVTNIIGKTPGYLNWLRYNTFFVLYPLGAGSEAWCIWRSLDEAKALSLPYYYVLVAILVSYAPGLYNQYTHMIKQRKKNTKGKKRMN
ncbi:hypothetical protein RUND412_010099 [Rhizina undulata]